MLLFDTSKIKYCTELLSSSDNKIFQIPCPGRRFGSCYVLQKRLVLLLCIYRTLNHIDRNALWIDLNAEDIHRNASQHSADAYTYSFINLIRQILIRVCFRTNKDQCYWSVYSCQSNQFSLIIVFIIGQLEP